MKLLVADFDDTLFDGKNYQKNLDYINKFTEAGHLFIIATGRYKDSLLSDMNGFKIPYSYLICNDGAIIFDKNLNVVYRKDIPKQISYDIAIKLKQENFIVSCYIDTGLTLTKEADVTANKVIGKFNNRDKAEELLEHINNKYSDVNGYLSTKWINITERNVNKGEGIKYVADLLNINYNNIYTIGDNINDLSMSNYKFNSYAMDNSVEELKKVTKKTYGAVYELIEDILKDE